MGNHLAGTAPSQILSVENYLADTTDHVFDKNLGSTRFMKVARAKYYEGLTVVKVFVMHDTSIDLEHYKEEVETIKSKLKQASNCLHFQETIIMDRAAFLIRQYVKHNLYDRISTRPFYNNIERRWAAFQLLCALNQMAKFNICHGDIKSENVLITSWNWLLLTDFASYKPLYIPNNNPAADFNYFFDTSRRRTCYIAPERFTDNSEVLASNQLKMSEHDHVATHAMDIFSTGCVIAELFTDGDPMFDLSQLLAYRENKFYPSACLKKIDDPHIRSLVEHMIQLTPSKRYTAEKYLTLWREKSFPNHFYTYLKFYMGRFCEPPLMSADQTVSVLHADLEKKILNNLNNENSDSLIIVASLLLSCIHHLKYCNSKLKALALIVQFAKHMKSDIILERFVPYLMKMIKDNVARVRAHAIHALATCMMFVREVPSGESNIFSEYILPALGLCAKDPEVSVRKAFAENIATLTEKSLTFLDSPQSAQNSSYISAAGGEGPSYDTQLQILRHMTQNRVQVMLSDSDSNVRQCLLEYSVSRLCTFFGRQKANDVLLSHMITFLNDKQDWQLRSAFFHSLVSVAAYIGQQSSNILKPLLLQGLSDSQEFVVSETMLAITSIIQLGLIPKQMICELMEYNIPFLVHPCAWIKQNAVALICECARALQDFDVHCYILPKLKPFLQNSILQVHKENILLSSLNQPVSHSIYDLVRKSSNIKLVYETLRNRKHHRELKTENTEENKENDNTLHKLIIQEMSVEDENKLLYLESYISKQQKDPLNNSSAIVSSKEWHHDENPGGSEINLLNLGPSLVRRHAELHKENDKVSSLSRNVARRGGNRKKAPPSVDVPMNDEWKTMFGTESSRPPIPPSKKQISNLTISMSELEHNSAVQLPSPPAETEKTDIKNKYASCQLDLRSLVHHRRDFYKYDVQQRRLEDSADRQSATKVSDWQPHGILVAHMLEHRGPIHKVLVNSSNQHFATVSSDKSMRLWDSTKFEEKSIVNRSKASLRFSGSVRCGEFCGDNRFVCASDDGHIHEVAIDLMGSKPQEKPDFSHAQSNPPIQFSYPVDYHTYGLITDLKSVVNSPLVVFSTSHGNVIALDMRDRRPAWEFKHDLCNGLPTTFCIDPKQHWLCLGTVRGSHVCWDLRFNLPITKFIHPAMAGIRKIITHPTRPSCIFSVVTGNNEVSIWDIETGTRQLTLWASSAPALSLTHKTSDSINGLHVSLGSNGIRMYTGGTDSKIRMWDLNQVENSKIVCGPDPSNSRTLYSVVYQPRLVDGTHVIQEQLIKTKRNNPDVGSNMQAGQEDVGEGKQIRPGEHSVPVNHHDVITDISMFQVNQSFLISTARDGVVKIWK